MEEKNLPHPMRLSLYEFTYHNIIVGTKFSKFSMIDRITCVERKILVSLAKETNLL